MEEEAIGTLDGPAPVERVIVPEDARTFHARATVAIIDARRYDFTGATWSWSSPTMVYSESRELIGSASLVMEGDRLVADLFLAYSTPERLTMETGISLYAQAMGSFKKVLPPLSEIGVLDFNPGPRRVLAVTVSHLRVTSKRPLDSRLDPIRLVP